MTRKYVPVWRQVDRSAGADDARRAGREILAGLLVLLLWAIAAWLWMSILAVPS